MSAVRSHILGYAEALECVVSVYRALDASNGTALARCFTEDAIWHRPDLDLIGRDQIEAMARDRDPSRTTIHVVGNLTLEGAGDQWIARYYLTVFAGREGIGGLVGILSCEDQILATNSGPLVAEKSSRPLLRPNP